MSAATSLVITFRQSLDNFFAYFKLANLYLKRHNPVQEIIVAVTMYVRDLLNANKKMMIARYRVNHLRYRLNQMEKQINDNNPYNQYKGSSINQLR